MSLVPIRDEFALIARALDAGVPVPEPLALERAGGRLATDGMLMSFVEGTSVAPRILRKPEFETARSRLAAQLGRGAGAHPFGRPVGPGRRAPGSGG